MSDYKALDRPEMVQFVFYPRKDYTSPPRGAIDHRIKVDEGVHISCRFYPRSIKSPTILFFHGNGEVVYDYDFIAPIYNSKDINLFVADYRGYGMSDGSPNFSCMVADSAVIFEEFCAFLDRGDYNGKIFPMGRSLGSISAIELAVAYQDDIDGLIVESGFASTPRLMQRLGFPPQALGIKDFGFPNLTRIKSVTSPTLILHGERDSLIPLEEGIDLYENVATEERRLVVIPGADHNDIMVRDIDLYMGSIEELVFAQ